MSGWPEGEIHAQFAIAARAQQGHAREGGRKGRYEAEYAEYALLALSCAVEECTLHVCCLTVHKVAIHTRGSVCLVACGGRVNPSQLYVGVLRRSCCERENEGGERREGG